MWGDFFLAKSPVFGEAKHPTGFEDVQMYFRTLFWFFEQLENTWTLHSDEN